MKTGKTVSLAVLSTLLAACTITHGTKAPREGNVSLDGFDEKASLLKIAQEYQKRVSDAKTVDLADNGLKIGDETGEYNVSKLPDGNTELDVSQSYENEKSGIAATATGRMLVYQQPYSVVTGVTWTDDGDSGNSYDLNVFSLYEKAFGLSTPATQLFFFAIQNEIFTYKGKAFNGTEEGTLSYTVEFGQQKGYGSISGIISTGFIELAEANNINPEDAIVNGMAIKADGSLLGQYDLSFYGPNAEEIAGGVHTTNGADILFGGARRLNKITN